MTPTLLLDLDDTLLGNQMDTFLPAYLQALSGHLASYIEPGKMVAALLDATRQMVANQDPSCTLQDVFDDAFYPVIGIAKDDLRPVLDVFYRQVFPTLQPLTQFRPEAVEMVDSAFGRGYRIAIATNPLFPRAASLERVRWAGFDLQKYPFALVSTYEHFHFAKPNPAYYAELLASLDWPDGPVLMVGDDLQRDIGPALQAGIPTFWIGQPGAPSDGALDTTGQGALADLLPWLDSQPAQALLPALSLPDALLATLLSTPAALDNLCRNLPPQAWKQRPGADQWSLTEIICHLRDVEREVNLPRIKRIIKENNPFIPGQDTDPWAEQRQYILQEGPGALHNFSAARQELLGLLTKSGAEVWERPARHAILGPTDLAELVGIVAEHDRLHVRQVRKGLSDL